MGRSDDYWSICSCSICSDKHCWWNDYIRSVDGTVWISIAE